MTKSYTFAHLVATQLRDAVVETRPGVKFVVSGRLDVESVLASVSIRIPWRFRDVKRHPPRVCCLEPWMKTGADWHNFEALCWTLPELWRDRMAIRRKTVASIMTEGCEWMRNNVSLLIARHYYAHLQGITDWPAEWEAWGHGRKGVAEYKREKREQNRVVLYGGLNVESIH